MALLLGYRYCQILFNIRLHDLLKLTVLLFIFMAMFLAETMDFYSRLFFYDKILHSFSGVMLFFLGQALYKRIAGKVENRLVYNRVMILFSIFFAVAMAGCWEIFEFTLDRTMGYHLQNDSLLDTMGDIICGTTTAVLCGGITYMVIRAQNRSYAEELTSKSESEPVAESLSQVL